MSPRTRTGGGHSAYCAIWHGFRTNFDTHLEMSDTIPNGDPATPYAHDTSLCGALLGPVLVMPDGFDRFRVGDDEMQYKLDHGALALWDLFDEHGISEALDPSRPSVAP